MPYFRVEYPKRQNIPVFIVEAATADDAFVKAKRITALYNVDRPAIGELPWVSSA